jgi:hypothetical protein
MATDNMGGVLIEAQELEGRFPELPWFEVRVRSSNRLYLGRCVRIYASDTKRTFPDLNLMSAIGGKPDIPMSCRYVR